MHQFINQWRDTEFESSTGPTPEFQSFARQFKTALRKEISDAFDIVTFRRGHFELSGFLRSKETGRFVYWNISDVRFFRNAWADHVLIRTATDATDYTGGANHFTTLEQFNETALRLAEAHRPQSATPYAQANFSFSPSSRRGA